MRINELHQLLQRKLDKPLPGLEAQELMAPSLRNPLEIKHRNPPRPSAVTLLLYQKGDEWYFPLIKRNVYSGEHSAQISLPGGKQEDEDHSLITTAIRETKEEIGVQLSEKHIMGKLSPLYIPISNFEVFPYIALYDTPVHFTPDTIEVQYIIEYPIKQLFDDNNKGCITLTNQKRAVEAPIYYSGEDYIWGATAMILSEFAELIKSSVL